MKWKSCMMALLVLLTFTACTPQEEEAVSAKPVIYLYPEQETDVTVQLDHDGPLTATYPAYEAGWNIHAKPDGTLIDPETGRMYYCLFWEGVTETEYDFSEGFCVAGADMADFLEQALAELGLTEREANEFLIYWLPQMEGNAYNLMAFQTEAYTDHARLTITGARQHSKGISGLETGGGAGGSAVPNVGTVPKRRIYSCGVGRLQSPLV